MTRDQILEIVKSDKKGYYTGNRLILPFRCNILKLIVKSHIYTEFVGNSDIKVSQETKNTSVYFRETGRLSRFEGSYQNIKMLIASEEDDLTDQSKHIRVICHVLSHRQIDLEMVSNDDLFLG